MRARLLTLLVLAVCLAAAPAAAAAEQAPLLPVSATIDADAETPTGFRIAPREAVRLAKSHPEVRRALREHPRADSEISIPMYMRGVYDVYFTEGSDGLADVLLNGRTGEVVKAWTGPQAYFPLARGEEPHVGHSLNSLWVWIPLALVFLLPFFDPRRPFRLLHLDLLVLLAFGVSQIFFNRGDVHVSVPLVYPLLVYLLVRLALVGFRPRPRGEPLVPYARVSWLAIGLVALVAFRLVLNVVDSSVIDVGYASVVGADRITQREELYVFNDVHGDTYGPVNYLAYIPFELVFPNDGTWREVPAAHAAAITFDLLTIFGLMLLGTRLRKGREGRRLGLALAFAWAAYPFTTYTLQSNTNDGLVAMLLVFALLALRSPAGRGALLGLAAAAKFAPLALAPLLATGTGEERRMRSWPAFAAALVGVVLVAVLLYLPDGGLREFWDATLGFQMSRDSPFSLWGLHPSLGWLQDAVKLGALIFATVVAFTPGRRDLRGVAGLAAAVLIAVQLPAIHWFYFYLVWIAPLALVAMFGAYRWTDRRARVTGGHMDEARAAVRG